MKQVKIFSRAYAHTYRIHNSARYRNVYSVHIVCIPLCLDSHCSFDIQVGVCDSRHLLHLPASGASPRHELHELVLSADLFAAAAMQQVSKDLLVMKVAELKEELEARGEGKSGNKSWLRRRLHAAILRNHL